MSMRTYVGGLDLAAPTVGTGTERAADLLDTFRVRDLEAAADGLAAMRLRPPANAGRMPATLKPEVPSEATACAAANRQERR